MIGGNSGLSEGSLDVVIDDYSFFHGFRVDSFKKRGAAKTLPRNSQITVLYALFDMFYSYSLH